MTLNSDHENHNAQRWNSIRKYDIIPQPEKSRYYVVFFFQDFFFMFSGGKSLETCSFLYFAQDYMINVEIMKYV